MEDTLFLFSGQGGQYEKMGHTLWLQSKLFRSVIEELSLDFEKLFDSDLYDYLFGTKSHLIQTVEYSAPLIYSLQVALVNYLRRSGIKPTIVCGSSMGEYAAGYSCGFIDYLTGLKALKLRNKLIARRVEGEMLFVSASVDEINPFLESSNIVALKNSPRATVISDRRENLESLASRLRKQKIRNFPLNCLTPFHSPLMTPIVEDYKHHLDQLTFSEKNKAIFYSSILNKALELVDSNYWIQNTLEPVELMSSFQTIEKNFAPSRVIEISGGNSLLTFYGDSNIDSSKDRFYFFFKKDEPNLQTIEKLLSEI